MSWVRDNWAIILAVSCIIAFLVPGVVLLALYHHDDVTMNTQGYFLPGGNCIESCGFESCTDTGYVEVGFFEPDSDSGNIITMFIAAPVWCLVVAQSSCCTSLILNQTLVWFYVETKNGEYDVKYVSFKEEANTGNFLIIGIALLIAATCGVCGCICCCLRDNSYTPV